MMSNPIEWFLNLQASLGLLPENYWAVPNAQVIVGGIAGLLAIIVSIATIVELIEEFYDDLDYRFDDNAFTRVGFRISFVGAVIILGPLAIALVTSIVAGMASMIVGLIFAYKIVFVVSILLIGPFLIAIGRLKTHKSKQARTEAQSSTSISSSLR